MKLTIQTCRFQIADLTNRLQTERQRFEERYQDIVAQFYHAQADYMQAMRECDYQKGLLQAKQELIQVLLAYYPHPITPELQHRIDLR